MHFTFSFLGYFNFLSYVHKILTIYFIKATRIPIKLPLPSYQTSVTTR